MSDKMYVKVNGTKVVMDAVDATMIAEGVQESESPEQAAAAWQYLVITGLAWQLQGWFGHTATSLIENGVIVAAKDYDAEAGITVTFNEE